MNGNRRSRMGRLSVLWIAVGLVAAMVMSMTADAAKQKWEEFKTPKYGYAFKLPAEFEIQGKEDKTTSWIYQPGSVATNKKEKKKFKIGLRVKGVSLGKSTETSTEGSGGGLESALTIYVNWVEMPDVSSATMYNTNRKSDLQDIEGRDPDYRDLKDFSKKQGYAYEGYTYWYKEVDKDSSDEIHRWHIKSYGNGSAYVVGLCGTYGQFQKWGPVYEEVVKSFRLVPFDEK